MGTKLFCGSENNQQKKEAPPKSKVPEFMLLYGCLKIKYYLFFHSRNKTALTCIKNSKLLQRITQHIFIPIYIMLHMTGISLHQFLLLYYFCYSIQIIEFCCFCWFICTICTMYYSTITKINIVKIYIPNALQLRYMYYTYISLPRMLKQIHFILFVFSTDFVYFFILICCLFFHFFMLSYWIHITQTHSE